MTPEILNRTQRWHVMFFAVAMGAALAAGFLPVSVSLFQILTHAVGADSLVAHELGKMAAFPILALFFFLSLPRSRRPSAFPTAYRTSNIHLTCTSVVPLLISAAFGYFHPAPSLFQILHSPAVGPILIWNLVCIPVGEELLFRGWIYNVAESLWPNHLFTATNPLPTAVWISAIMFSIWHVQNIGREGVGMTALQLAYTLIAGLWFGYLRLRTGGLRIPILAHTGLNVVSGIF